MKAATTIGMRIWRAALSIAFAALCVRFIGASFVETVDDNWSAPLLVICSAAFSFLAPFPVLFAFTASLPLLAGLGQTAMLPIPIPASLVFCSIWLGYQARIAWGAFGRRRERPQRDPKCRHAAGRYPIICTDLLMSAIVVSAAIQACLVGGSVDWTRAFKQPIFAYIDPLYFLDAAFVWLQGLFFFRCLWESEAFSALSAFEPQTGSPKRNMCSPLQDAGPTRYWIRPVLGTYAVAITVFLALQYALHFPVGWVAAGYFSPFEDISSFGSIAASVMIFWLAAFSGSTLRHMVREATLCIAMLLAVVASWSRAAWLSATCFLLVTCWLRLPRKWSLSIVGVLCALVAIGNFEGNRPSWQGNEYLARFVSLVRLENPANKDAGRFNLYHKALGMIEARPLWGHMIGSFYGSAAKYAAADDPFGTRPDFAHDVLLQVAAELGVPVALLFLALCGFTIYSGITKCPVSGRRARKISGNIGTHSSHSMPYINAKILPLLGAILALAVYLGTQMTANSLNVYASNQFFFWFLMAVVLLHPGPVAEASAERLETQ